MAEQDFNRLLKTLNLLNAELTRAKINIDVLSNVPTSGGLSAFKDMVDKVVALRKEIVATRAQLDSLYASTGKGTTGGGPRQNIPGGYSEKNAPQDFGIGDIRKQYAKALEDETALSKLSSKNKQSELSELQKLEKERLETVRGAIQSNKKYAQALKVAAEQKFTINDLTGVQNRGTGIDRLQFRKYDEQGVRKDLDLYTSPTGKVTPGISNQFRTFGQGVLRDIGELTKWSIALAAVYGPLKKLQELTQTMIENQTKLAEASIAVNSAFVSQGDIFDIAANAATRAGEEITGVIEAFTLAYRAAGGAGNEIERMATATKLLNDSLTLSKLSTLDQATSIDTLAAALRQTTGDLNAGSQLLDKWVKVTKIANVDLGTLATGFAVLGDAAEAAGIGVDELNGVVAVIAETGISSGRETAAIARAIVSGFQSDKARGDLENLGIAVTDTTGKMRPFLDVMQEIYNLRRSGAISDTQFSDLTLSLGGGTRRQAAYATFIENFDRVFSIADESSKASGDAEEALAKQLETVQTSLTRLGNAFEELAQTLGTEGGFLGIVTGIVDGMTSLVNVFDGLVSILGKATPALAAFIATSILLRSQGITNVQSFIGTQALGLGGPSEIDKRLAQVTGAPLPLSQKVPQDLRNNVFGTNAASGISQGLLLSAIPALSNYNNKDDRFGKLKAGADIVGGVAGGVIGSLVAGSPLIGAAIGTSISEAFVNSTIARQTDLFGYQKTTTVVSGETKKSEEDAELARDPRKALEQAEIGLYESVGFGSESFGRFLTSGESLTGVEKLVEEINKAIKGGAGEEDVAKLIAKSPGYTSLSLKSAGITKELIAEAVKTGGQIEYTPESTPYRKASDEARKAYDEALSAFLASAPEQKDISTPFGDLVQQNKDTFKPLLDSIAEDFRDSLSKERLEGDIKGTAYTTQLNAISGFDTKALQYYTALGDTFIEMNKDVDDVNEAFEAFALITTKGSQESVQEVTRITGEIQKLINLLGDPILNETILKEDYGGQQQAQKQLESLQATGSNLVTDILNQVRLNDLDIPDIQGDREKPLQRQEFQSVLQLAKTLQEEFYKGFLDVPDELFDSMKKNFDTWAQIVEDSGDVFYSKVSEIDPQFFQQALTKLIEEGKIGSQKVDPFSIQQLDITSGEGANLQGTIDYFSNYLSQNFPQYQQNPEEFGVIFSDYVTDVLHGDNLAVQLALDKLVELNQKQLDGQYNIPEGATFWVPLTAAYYKPENQGGLGAGTIDTSSLDGSATELDGAADNLNSAAEALKSLLTLKEETRLEAILRKGEPDYEGTKKVTDSPFQPKQPFATSNDDFIKNFLSQKKQEELNKGLQAYYEGQNLALGRTSLPSSADSSVKESFLENSGIGAVVDSMKGLIGTLQQIFGGQQGQPGDAGLGVNITQDNATNVSPVLNARLDFQVDNTTQLVVDGRVLASIVTPYLASDLLRIEASQGSITKRYVI